MDARNRNDVAYAPRHICRQRRGCRHHPAGEMASGRMPGQHQRPVDQFGRLADRRADLLDDAGDANFGQSV